MAIPLDATEQALLESVPQALESGLELLRWWRQTDEAGTYAETYPETYVVNRPDDRSFGFFDTAPLSRGPIAVNGNVQEMFYDGPKVPHAKPLEMGAAQWMNQQVREFILGYFMRISDFRQPQQVPEASQPPPPGLGFLSQCPGGDAQRIGFGFSQLYFQRRNGELGRFRPVETNAIIDLRHLRDDFQWIVLRNPIFDFGFKLAPFGDAAPQMVLPISEFNYLVMSPHFVVDESHPEPGILGRYGFGYAFVNRPEPSPLAYGPGELEPAFELLVWDVHESGDVTVRATFVARQPTAMLNLSIDPAVWGLQAASVLFGSPSVQAVLQPFRRFYNSLPWSKLRFDPVFPAVDLLNVMTLNQASERFCISRTQIMKYFLFLHFLQHYQTLLGSLQTWRQIPDWLDTQNLPSFVRDGRSA